MAPYVDDIQQSTRRHLKEGDGIAGPRSVVRKEKQMILPLNFMLDAKKNLVALTLDRVELRFQLLQALILE